MLGAFIIRGGNVFLLQGKGRGIEQECRWQWTTKCRAKEQELQWLGGEEEGGAGEEMDRDYKYSTVNITLE